MPMEAPLFAVAPQVESRLDSVEMRVSSMFSRMDKMTELMERFINRALADSAPAQHKLAPHLPVVALERYQMPAMQPTERTDVEEEQQHDQAEMPPSASDAEPVSRPQLRSAQEPGREGASTRAHWPRTQTRAWDRV